MLMSFCTTKAWFRKYALTCVIFATFQCLSLKMKMYIEYDVRSSSVLLLKSDDSINPIRSGGGL